MYFMQMIMLGKRYILVPAGKYKVVIKKGRDTFEKTIDVTYKNNARLNEDDMNYIKRN